MFPREKRQHPGVQKEALGYSYVPRGRGWVTLFGILRSLLVRCWSMRSDSCCWCHTTLLSWGIRNVLGLVFFFLIVPCWLMCLCKLNLVWSILKKLCEGEREIRQLWQVWNVDGEASFCLCWFWMTVTYLTFSPCTQTHFSPLLLQSYCLYLSVFLTYLLSPVAFHFSAAGWGSDRLKNNSVTLYQIWNLSKAIVWFISQSTVHAPSCHLAAYMHMAYIWVTI